MASSRRPGSILEGFTGHGQDGGAGFGLADAIEGIQLRHGFPDALVFLIVRRQSRDRVRPAFLGEHHLVCNLLVVTSLTTQGDRQDSLNGRAQVTALRKRQRPADHRKGAAVHDVARHVLQIGHREITPRVEILEDDQVEVSQLPRKQLLGGEGDEAELALGHVHHVVGSTQDDERQQIDAGVELEGLAQEAIIPGRAAAHQQHADFVAHDGEREVHAIVVGKRFAEPWGDADRIGKFADRVRLQGEGHLLLGGVRIDQHALRCHHAAIALQDDG